jgi:putative chitinase
MAQLILLSKEQFIKIFQKGAKHQFQSNLDLLVRYINEAMLSADINTPQRIAAFCAQIAVETDELSKLVENLNYSASLLQQFWPKRFPTSKIAQQYAHNPEKIANYVYGSRLGNGPEATGEGWLYRGRGAMQLTGKDNYAIASKLTGIDLIADPTKAIEPSNLFKIATAYWTYNKINEISDTGNIDDVSKKVNGGINGLLDRRSYYGVILGILK